MHAIRSALREKQMNFGMHPFFSALSKERSVEQLSRFAPRMTFWILAFQDVLRLNERLVTDPVMKRIAHHHRREDSGHDRWFLQDLAVLGAPPLDAANLFGRAHVEARDATFQLVAEVHRATSDLQRIVLILALEAAGHIFFERVSAALRGRSEKLKYFSDYHLKVEKAHEVFEKNLEAELDSIVVTEAERTQVVSMLDRVFDAFGVLFDGLSADMDRPSERAA